MCPAFLPFPTLDQDFYLKAQYHLQILEPEILLDLILLHRVPFHVPPHHHPEAVNALALEICQGEIAQ